MLSRILLCLICFACFITTANARMYKWVDGDGVTQYSQSAPPSAGAKEIAPPPLPSATRKLQKPANEDSASATEEIKENSDGKKAPSSKEIAASESIKKENCGLAKSNLDLYTNLGRKILKTPGGLYKRLTEEERQEKIKQSQAAVKEYCGK